MTGNRMMALLLILAALPACTPKPRDVVAERFPQCFAEPVIGATTGVKCDHDEQKDEWRITFWNGWGDCQAGCINKQETAWYLVDKDGKVYRTDKDFNIQLEIKPDQNLEGKDKGIDIKPENLGGTTHDAP